MLSRCEILGAYDLRLILITKRDQDQYSTLEKQGGLARATPVASLGLWLQVQAAWLAALDPMFVSPQNPYFGIVSPQYEGIGGGVLVR